MSREQQERERQKALLLRLIQQQRLDLSASHRHWLEATAPIDRGWNTLLNLRSWAMVGSGLVAIWSVRHPRFLMRWAKRSLGIWSTWPASSLNFMTAASLLLSSFLISSAAIAVLLFIWFINNHSESLKKIYSFPC